MFADAHGFVVGDQVLAIINGKVQVLSIVGVALSPEYVIQVQPGSILPDDKRFGVFWVSENDLEAAFDMVGAFNSVSIRLACGNQVEEAIEVLDRLLKPFGYSNFQIGSAMMGAYDAFYKFPSLDRTFVTPQIAAAGGSYGHSQYHAAPVQSGAFHRGNFDGVLASETMRAVATRIRFQNRSRRIGIMGVEPDAKLLRLLNADEQPVRVPDFGIMLNTKLAHLLGVKVSDTVIVEVLEYKRPTLSLEVEQTAIASRVIRIQRRDGCVFESRSEHDRNSFCRVGTQAGCR